VYVLGDGTIHTQTIQSQRKILRRSGAFRPDGLNGLRLERRGGKYHVAVNGVVAGDLRVQIGKVKFKTIRLSLGPERPPRAGPTPPKPGGVDVAKLLFGGGARPAPAPNRFRADDRPDPEGAWSDASPRIQSLRVVTFDPGS
jgi:hypothetical protein